MKHRMRLRGNLKTYLRWPLFFGILLILMTIQLFSVSVRSGVIGIGYTILYLMIAGLINFSGRRKLKKDLIEFATNYGEMQMRMMKTLTVPFAILSEDGHMLWGNDEFVSVIVNKKAARRNIANIFEEITLDSLPDSDEVKVVHVRTEDKYYRVVMKLVESDNAGEGDTVKTDINQLMDNSRLISVFLYDETDIMELEQKREAENLVVGLLYIDNYDELIDSIDEIRQSLIMALIDRKINKYMQGIDAISKKLEKDKFLFMFKQSYLSEICSNRFAILEEIRDINLGNESSATISIGIGVGRDTFVERYDLARAAIDLALGRGGDQAVVKSIDQEKFYGGKSVQIERNTRVKARVKAHALKELIEGKERVVVMGHSIGDVDSFGASIGIYRIAKTLNRKANVVLNEVSQSVKPIRDRFYTKEYEEDMIITGDEAKELVDENTVLVIVDVNRASYTECPELIEQAQSVVVIDHHRQAGDAIDKAVLFYIEPYASSASEMVAEISQYIGSGLKLKSAEAEAMYAGIMIDTNYFSNKTGVRTFEAMAYLRRNGADAVRIRKAFREDIDEYKIRAAAIQDTELYEGVFAIAESKSEGIESPTVFASKIANSLLDISNVKASFVLTKYRGKVYISARSIDEVNVQVMMERLGGGGHINMAGAQLENVEVEEAKNMIKQEIDRMIEEGEI
ncbi:MULTISPECIES: DHH family phosphoesterase [Clostridia]|uniref:Cyclic-di-AMP phosphodiesterase n=1 Tax=Butyribacter intestini TaxID=1703332 RepID=A0AAW3JTP9_9FIRM|nr:MULTISPECIES: DHH family phosphoesterase [Clostridia]KQC85656.1 phosphoesterase [Butyribacter intestini]RHP22427.1 DHH family phosphoesterase [Clostridium sp. AF34-13]RHU76754.1 DHH family phosphoesterase [Butyribacter intestini]